MMEELFEMWADDEGFHTAERLLREAYQQGWADALNTIKEKIEAPQ